MLQPVLFISVESELSQFTMSRSVNRTNDPTGSSLPQTEPRSLPHSSAQLSHLVKVHTLITIHVFIGVYQCCYDVLK